ncbi:Sentrin-specific protease 5, partial [Ameca splendens]
MLLLLTGVHYLYPEPSGSKRLSCEYQPSKAMALGQNRKVHFFNSFFYKQLVAKGYDGVKRWTKKVDLFSKWLLLIPIHLEIHWSLIAVTMATKTISYYDSQGIVFRHTTN